MITTLVADVPIHANDRDIVMALRRIRVAPSGEMPMRLGLLNEAGDLYRIVACDNPTERARVVDALARLGFQPTERRENPLLLEVLFAKA